MGDEATYTVTKTETALGVAHEFHGPGLRRGRRDVHFMQPMSEVATQRACATDADSDASRVRELLDVAYQAGRESMAEDVRRLLGVRGADR